MADDDAKSVGETFVLIAKGEASSKIGALARVCTFAENAMWFTWRLHDPMRFTSIAELVRIKNETGKWPKPVEYDLKSTPEGESATKIARDLCPGTPSWFYDAIANQVGKLYRKKRRRLLTFQERIPIGHDERIRFRERAVLIRRKPDYPHYFQAGIRITSEETLWVDMKTAGKSEYTMR